MNKTSIEWTDYTSNLIRYRDPEGRSVHGCIKVSAGCTTQLRNTGTGTVQTMSSHNNTLYVAVREAE